ncbi:MAG: helix-turn-helix domain-containing protein [Clostridiales bacterium]|jgi:putative transcriptional regulator|nr:helix-turn-helix domain-containing protein [Clostridiales bacterium]
MSESLPAAIGQIVRAHRERAGLTQAELAVAANVSESYIQRIEYGQRTPTITVFLQLARAFDVESTEFLQEILRLQTILSNTPQPHD